MQTRMAVPGGEPRGNCMEACIASLLETPIEEVIDLWAWEKANPNSVWQLGLEDWLKPRGLTLVQVQYEGGYLPDFYHIMSGPGPRGIRHAVVGLGGELAHDPHPEGGGLVETEILSMLVPLDVARMG